MGARLCMRGCANGRVRQGRRRWGGKWVAVSVLGGSVGRMNRRLVIFSSFLALSLGLASCSRSNKLIIGTDATYPPFEILDASGQFVGADIDLGRELARHLGREVEFQNINFDGLIAALKSGSVDLVLSSMTANEERRKSIDFSEPYVKTGIAILAHAKAPVQTAEDLKAPGRRIVVRLGTSGEQYARTNLPQAAIVALDSDTACVMEVVKGGAEAWIYDQLSIMNYHARHPDTTRALLQPLREEVWAIGLRKGNDELKAKVNAFLAKFRADGGFTRLAEKHMAKEKQAMEGQGIPFVFEIGR